MSPDDFTLWNCCICGSTIDPKWCPECGHWFCAFHRSGWAVWDRGWAAIKQHVRRKPPQYCHHDRRGNWTL